MALLAEAVPACTLACARASNASYAATFSRSRLTPESWSRKSPKQGASVPGTRRYSRLRAGSENLEVNDGRAEAGIPPANSSLPSNVSFIKEEADRILQSEESKALLKDLADAAERAEIAKKELYEIARMERELLEENFQQKYFEAAAANEASADALVRDAEADVIAAEERVREAGMRLIQARAGSSSRTGSSKWEDGTINENAERLESGKAAAISGLVAIAANFPFVLVSSGGFSMSNAFSGAVLTTTCVLFGVTYRYILRRDLGNNHLKSGAVAAFALVRALAQVDTAQVLLGNSESYANEAIQVALNAGEGLIVVAFVAAALDFALREEFLQPFPSRKNVQ